MLQQVVSNLFFRTLRKAPSSLRSAGALQMERFCRTVTNQPPTSNWRSKHAPKTNPRLLKSFVATAREYSELPAGSFDNAAWSKKQHRRFS
jgi:hypothetical protein